MKAITCRSCGHTHYISEEGENDTIISVVTKYFNIPKKQIISRSREWKYVYPRQVAMWLLRKEKQNTSTKVGELFKRDHATVLHGVKHITDLMFTDPEVRTDIQNIEELINQTKAA